MAFIFVAFFAVGLAFGQERLSAKFEIPFEFTVGSKVLPAGTYTFTESGDTRWLIVKSATGAEVRALIISRINGPTELLEDGSLVFDRSGGGHLLSEVWMPDKNGFLVNNNPKDYVRENLLAEYVSQNRTLSGKTTYNLTCGKCHGPAGRGDEGADKFFNMKIPRLNSPDVQAKLDTELKQIITQGTSTMPPVEIEESGYKHRLPSQDVDGVIAYVRSLKQ
jgi:mono/diheme cytochrome c family protein